MSLSLSELSQIPFAIKSGGIGAPSKMITLFGIDEAKIMDSTGLKDVMKLPVRSDDDFHEHDDHSKIDSKTEFFKEFEAGLSS